MKPSLLVIICSVLAGLFLSWIIGVIGLVVGFWMMSNEKKAAASKGGS